MTEQYSAVVESKSKTSMFSPCDCMRFSECDGYPMMSLDLAYYVIYLFYVSTV